MILMFGLLGLRTGSIIALNIEHIDLEAGLAWVKEKGQRERQVVLPDLVTRLLGLYLAQLPQATGPLFLSIQKKRISARILQDIFQSAADQLGIDKRLHAHLFRHTAATQIKGVRITGVKKGRVEH